MKRIHFLFFALIFTSLLNAQQEPMPIKVSTERVMIGGQVYVIHMVQPGQTAYSIARAYGITVDDIATVNPGVSVTNLGIGQALRIPVIIPVEEKADDPLPQFEDKDFDYYTVKPGQTVYYYSRRYNLPLETIYRFNQGIEPGIKAGQVIKIPKRRIMREAIEAAQDTSQFRYHEVKRKETLYSLSVQYGITVADIINHNPELRYGLKSGAVLRIPKESAIIPVAKEEEEPTPSYPLLLTSMACDSIMAVTGKNEIRISLLLPLHSDHGLQGTRLPADSHEAVEDTELSVDLRRANKIRGGRFFEFYQGTLLALEKLKTEGYQITIQVLDTRMDTTIVKKLLTAISDFNPDLIIGPIYPEEIGIVKRYGCLNSIPIVSPLHSRTEQLNSCQSLFQAMPSRESEYVSISNFLKAHPEANLIYIQDEDTLGSREFFKHFMNLPRTPKGPIMFNVGNIQTLLHLLKRDSVNIILVSSINEAYISILLSRLADRSFRDFDIIIAGQSPWLTFRNIETELFHQLGVAIFTPFYVDYNNERTLSCITQFTQLFRYQPIKIGPKGYIYAYLGYDLTLYFTRAVARYGKFCPQCISYFPSDDTLLSRYRFEQREYGGSENSRMNLIRFSKGNFNVEIERLE